MHKFSSTYTSDWLISFDTMGQYHMTPLYTIELNQLSAKQQLKANIINIGERDSQMHKSFQQVVKIYCAAVPSWTLISLSSVINFPGLSSGSSSFISSLTSGSCFSSFSWGSDFSVCSAFSSTAKMLSYLHLIFYVNILVFHLGRYLLECDTLWI